MTRSSVRFLVGSEKGFTLLEVMVGLIIGTLLVGGVMELLSTSLQFNRRLDDKSRIQPVLEAVAQDLLIHPEKVQEGRTTLLGSAEAPPVEVVMIRVDDPKGPPRGTSGQLFRVQLSCRNHALEFSILVPRSALQ